MGARTLWSGANRLRRLAAALFPPVALVFLFSCGGSGGNPQPLPPEKTPTLNSGWATCDCTNGNGLIAVLDLARARADRTAFVQPTAATGLSLPSLAIDRDRGVLYSNAIVDSRDRIRNNPMR